MKTRIRGLNTIFRDMILLMLFGFITIIILILPHLNVESLTKNDQEIEAQGNLIFEVFWEPGLSADIDLWVQTPVGNKPIYFQNKQNEIASLLRDDLGSTGDVFERNDEILFVRGLKAGEYIVNIHFYKNSSDQQLVDVILRVTHQSKRGKAKIIFINRDNPFNLALREEITALRFHVTDDGRIEDVNNVPFGMVARFLKPRP